MGIDRHLQQGKPYTAAALVGLGYGEHLDVVDAVAAAGARRGAGWQRKVLVFGHVRGDVGTQRHGEVPALSVETQPHHHDAGTVVLKHELAVALDEVEEVLGMDTIFIGYAPSYEAGPASLQTPTGGRYSTPCGTPSPTEVKRTRKPYSESRGFRQVIYNTQGRFQCA